MSINIKKKALNVKNGDTYDNFDMFFLGDVGEAVDDWFEEHPDGAVPDGSLTEVKLSEQLTLKTVKDYVTPQMFGAKGDGTTDDTESVQSAFDSGKNVYFPKGTYKVSSPITVNSFTSVKGAGINESTIINVGNSCCFQISNKRDITFDSLNIKGDYSYGESNPSGNTLDGIELNHCSFMTFRDVAFWFNGENGVNYKNNSYACYFYNCIFSFNGGNGFDASDTTNPASDTSNFIGCRFGGNAEAGLVFNGSVLTIVGGVIEANADGVVLLSSVSPASNVYLDGVDIEGNTDHAIVFATDSNVEPSYLNIMRDIKIIGGQVSGKTGNESLFHFDIARQSYKRVIGLEISSLCSPFDGNIFTTETTDTITVVGKIDDAIWRDHVPSTIKYYIGTQLPYKSNATLSDDYIKSNKVYRSSSLQNVVKSNDSLQIEFENYAYIETISFTVQSTSTIVPANLVMYAVDYTGTTKTITPTLSYDVLTYSINSHSNRTFYIINSMSDLVYLYNAKYNGSIPI